MNLPTRGNNGDLINGGNKSTPLAVVIAFVSGIGGSLGYQLAVPPYAPSNVPSERKVAELERRIDKLELIIDRAVSNSEEALGDHKSVVENFYSIIREHERSYHRGNPSVIPP